MSTTKTLHKMPLTILMLAALLAPNAHADECEDAWKTNTSARETCNAVLSVTPKNYANRDDPTTCNVSAACATGETITEDPSAHQSREVNERLDRNTLWPLDKIKDLVNCKGNLKISKC